MSEIILKKLKQFPSFEVDLECKKIVNLKSNHDVDLDEVFEISHILDSSYFNYKVDNNLNIIVLDKK